MNGLPVRFRVLYGGRDSTKSTDAAIRATWLSHRGKIRVLCTRMYQNRIEESVYTSIKKQIQRFGLSKHFDVQRSKIYSDTGSEFLFYGLARNIEEIKSIEDIDILYIEEGQSLTEEMWDVLEPTIRKQASEIWIVFNPQYRTDFVWQKFIENPPANALVRKVNYPENPFLSETSKITIAQRKELDYEAYEHIYEGVPKEDEEDIIIKRAWIQAAVDAHKKLDIDVSGLKRIGYDVADSGGDKNAIAKRYGILIEGLNQWSGGQDELMKSTKRVYNEAVKGYDVRYDSIGVGAGVGSNINEINEVRGANVRHYTFNAGGKVVNPEKEYMKGTGVKNKDHFKNLKAQSWMLLADRFRNTYNAVTKGADFNEADIISISSECDYLQMLITELSTPKKEYDNAGRMKVESKEKLLKRGVKSPNLADAVVMSFAPQTKKTKLRVSMA